ncbi:ABC transporter permease, partial [Staphylococcus agnetis]
MINLKNVLNVVYKDVIEAKNDQGALIPMIIIPFLFSVLLPLLIILGGSSNVLVNFIGGIRVFIEQLPTNVLPHSIDDSYKITYAIFMYFFIPFFILIPVLISTILSSSSFTGEKERKTIEGLLFTPLNNLELILGKILAAAIPSVIITWISIIIYGIIINVHSIRILDRMIFPNFNWILITLFVVPLVTFLSISLVVAISHRVKTSKSAQSVSMLLILPIIGFLISQASGV